MITVRLDRDEITPDLRRLLREADADGALGRILGRAAANDLRRHFRAIQNWKANMLEGKFFVELIKIWQA